MRRENTPRFENRAVPFDAPCAARRSIIFLWRNGPRCLGPRVYRTLADKTKYSFLYVSVYMCVSYEPVEWFCEKEKTTAAAAEERGRELAVRKSLNIN